MPWRSPYEIEFAETKVAGGRDPERWLKPVRPDDVLRLRVTVLEANPSRSKPDRGLVRALAELFNQDNDLVLKVTVLNILRRRS